MLVLNGRGAGRAPAADARSAGLLARSGWVLLALLGLGLAVRLGLLLGPFGQLEADESIVGLMARHILAATALSSTGARRTSGRWSRSPPRRCSRWSARPRSR